MAKPILLSVDDDSDVLRAIERDLRVAVWRGVPRYRQRFSRRRHWNF